MAPKRATVPRSPVVSAADVQIPAGRGHVEGVLTLPADTKALVVFAHGSGSSRSSPRNIYVAGELQRAGMGTLLMDLLTEAEDADPEARFDISLLGRRLVEVTAWAKSQPSLRALPLGYFGASTGAAAALVAAAAPDNDVKVIVSRGGRPDMAGEALGAVRAPTLLIVGAEDTGVIELNEQALRKMRCERKLVLVPGATHLFEEPGTLEKAAGLATAWFERWIR